MRARVPGPGRRRRSGLAPGPWPLVLVSSLLIRDHLSGPRCTDRGWKVSHRSRTQRAATRRHRCPTTSAEGLADDHDDHEHQEQAGDEEHEADDLAVGSAIRAVLIGHVRTVAPPTRRGTPTASPTT